MSELEYINPCCPWPHGSQVNALVLGRCGLAAMVGQPTTHHTTTPLHHQTLQGNRRNRDLTWPRLGNWDRQTVTFKNVAKMQRNQSCETRNFWQEFRWVAQTETALQSPASQMWKCIVRWFVKTQHHSIYHIKVEIGPRLQNSILTNTFWQDIRTYLHKNQSAPRMSYRPRCVLNTLNM